MNRLNYIRNFIRLSDWSKGKLSLLYLILIPDIMHSNSKIDIYIYLTILTSILAVIGYTLNNYADLNDDIIANKINPFERISLVKGKAYLIIIFICIIILIISPFTLRSICTKKWYLETLILIQLVATIVYSCYPFRLKNRGVLGLYASVIAQYLAPTMIYLLFTSLTITEWIYFITMFMLNGITLEIGHQLYDLKNDIKVGLKTYASTVNPIKLNKIYNRLLVISTLFIHTYPSYILYKIYATIDTHIFYVITISYLWILVVQSLALNRYIKRNTISEYDPFYNSQGNIFDRIFTYIPNIFYQLFFTLFNLTYDLSVFPYFIYFICWARVCMAPSTYKDHLTEIKYVLLPPEFFKRYFRF